MVDIPSDLRTEIDALVADGTFPSRDAAVAELLRLGLMALRARPGRPPVPPPPARPAPPPGVNEPQDDRPIQVNPWDVNWME